MLVLSRKLNDEIVINDNITVRVLRVKGNTVRLGVEAPAEVSVMRGELPRREIEFTIEMESESEEEDVEAEKADSEHEISGIQFRSQFPTPMRRNRLAEIASRINGAK
jgi:carbon storage regulator CsrA